MDLSGNKDLLQCELVAFFASRTAPSQALEKSLLWAEQMAKSDSIVISGFHSPIERAVLDLLLERGCSVVVTLGRSLYKKIPLHLRSAYEQKRVLFISFRDYSRPSFNNSQLRNWATADLAQKVVFAQFENSSQLSSLHYSLQIGKKQITILK